MHHSNTQGLLYQIFFQHGISSLRESGKCISNYIAQTLNEMKSEQNIATKAVPILNTMS